tara:strand:+ start:1137 stop:1259 length:123 start_codon:yes stop_codon:yes gene_type:complete
MSSNGNHYLPIYTNYSLIKELFDDRIDFPKNRIVRAKVVI